MRFGRLNDGAGQGAADTSRPHEDRPCCESLEPVFLESHGGDLNGFTLLRGDRDKLASIRTSDEFERLSLRAGLIVEGSGVIGAVLGEGIGTLMGVYDEQVEELT